jgi:AcrR family transcriptional regulator
MEVVTGLRERKKQQTRRRIASAALELFAERGFDNVPVAQVAQAADVSEATVFNYFRTKEDLVYAGMESFEQQLLETVQQRPAGVSVFHAFRDYVLQPRGALAAGDPAAIAQLATVARVIAASPALQARERQVADHMVQALSKLIARERRAGPSDLRPNVVASALVAVNRAMTQAVQRQAQEGRSGPAIARGAMIQGRKAFDLLETGVETL